MVEDDSLIDELAYELLKMDKPAWPARWGLIESPEAEKYRDRAKRLIDLVESIKNEKE